MRVLVKSIVPVQDKDGSWHTVVEERYEDVPDLGRENVLCNSCKTKNYPECKEICNCWQENDDKS